MNVTRVPQDVLFSRRMTILGLDLDAIERDDSKTFNELKERCAKCDFRDACAIDLWCDPNTPVWEAYCPNSGMLNVLVDEWCPYWRRYMSTLLSATRAVALILKKSYCPAFRS
jgi:hypothetical protein